jgi:hypothetical protein
MSGMFGGGPPAPTPQATMPQEDDLAARRAALKARRAYLDADSGRVANQLNQTRTARSTYTPAQTRKGVDPMAGRALLTG